MCDPNEHDYMPVKVTQSRRSWNFIFYDRTDTEYVEVICRKCGHNLLRVWTGEKPKDYT